MIGIDTEGPWLELEGLGTPSNLVAVQTSCKLQASHLVVADWFLLFTMSSPSPSQLNTPQTSLTYKELQVTADWFPAKPIRFCQLPDWLTLTTLLAHPLTNQMNFLLQSYITAPKLILLPGGSSLGCPKLFLLSINSLGFAHSSLSPVSFFVVMRQRTPTGRKEL